VGLIDPATTRKSLEHDARQYLALKNIMKVPVFKIDFNAVGFEV
jgi:hypothetical protein